MRAAFRMSRSWDFISDYKDTDSLRKAVLGTVAQWAHPAQMLGDHLWAPAPHPDSGDFEDGVAGGKIQVEERQGDSAVMAGTSAALIGMQERRAWTRSRSAGACPSGVAACPLG